MKIIEDSKKKVSTNRKMTEGRVNLNRPVRKCNGEKKESLFSLKVPGVSLDLGEEKEDRRVRNVRKTIRRREGGFPAKVEAYEDEKAPKKRVRRIRHI